MMEIGAQMYTVRDAAKDLEGFAASLTRIADIGYRIVQVSGTCPFEAEWLKKELARTGLKCVLTHTPPARLQGETDKVVAEHDVFGCRYIGLGSYGFREENNETVESFKAVYLPIAKKMRGLGKYFMYHNHDKEFKKENGRLILDRLAEEVPAEDMGFTLDTFWVQAGGGDPAAWLEKLKGRVPCIHLKDYAYGRKMAVIGEGNINFDRVFREAEAAGTEYMLVEQDDCGGEDPFECLRRSFMYLRSRGFR